MKRISKIEEIDEYISRFQKRSKNGKRGQLRIVETRKYRLDTVCWEWIGAETSAKKELSKRKVSYGIMGLDENLADWLLIEGFSSKRIRLHWLMYHCYVEELNDKWLDLKRNRLEIAHRCQNPKCCRPDHLEVMSRDQNTKDRVKHRKMQDKDMKKLQIELDWWREKGTQLGISFDPENYGV